MNRQKLRTLQDMFLKHPEVKLFEADYGIDEPVFDDGTTIRMIRECILPDHERTFKDYIS